MPRAASTSLRLSRLIVRGMWYAWPRVAGLLFDGNAEAREDFLGTYAPLFLVVLLIAWVLSLLIGWALVFYALRSGLRPHGMGFGDCVYYAGASLLTIGYGDIVAHTMIGRLLSLACAASGLAVVAVVISFLFSIFGAFQAREQFVVTVGARAGMPPSGVGLLEVLSYAGLRSELAQIFREGQFWAAAVMETHLAYPTLMYFRSSHDYQSWVGTLGTLLDASALVISAVEPAGLEDAQCRGQAMLMFEIGKHLVNDFSNYFQFYQEHPEPGPGIEREEFAHALERLQAAGYATREPAAAWREFALLRMRYGQQLNALARWMEIPPLQWIGDRSLLALHNQPH